MWALLFVFWTVRLKMVNHITSFSYNGRWKRVWVQREIMSAVKLKEFNRLKEPRGDHVDHEEREDGTFFDKSLFS